MPNLRFSQADIQGLIVISSNGRKFFIDPPTILTHYQKSVAQDPKQETASWVVGQLIAAVGSDQFTADQIIFDFDETTGIPISFGVQRELSANEQMVPVIVIVNPIDGQPVFSGVLLQAKADAASPNKVSTVTFTIDTIKNPLVATFNSSSGYWEIKWDSTTVLDGKIGIVGTVTDNIGTTATNTITVLVKN